MHGGHWQNQDQTNYMPAGVLSVRERVSDLLPNIQNSEKLLTPIDLSATMHRPETPKDNNWGICQLARF